MRLQNRAGAEVHTDPSTAFPEARSDKPRYGLVMRSLGLGFMVLVLSCSSCGEDAKNPGASASSSGSASGGTSSGSSGQSSGTTSSGGNGSSSGTSGNVDPTTPDDGLIPSTSIWRTTTEWYRVIENAPVAETSGEMIAALAQWGLQDKFMIDFSFNVLDGAGGTPTTFPEGEETDNGVPVPVPAKGYVEGDHAYDACPLGEEDCHMLIVDRGANRLYELYQVRKDGANWNGELSLWKLDKTYPRSNRGQGCTSADAAGLPITPGLIGYKETKKGEIRHALRFIIRNEYIRGKKGDKNVPNVVYPASHGATQANAATGIPYGGRLRLKIKEDDPRVKTPGGKAVVKALHTYGMILADGGNIPLVAESAKVAHDADPSATWEGLLGSHDLDFIRPGDFEVIAIPKDNPSHPDAGWYQTKADYESQLKKPLDCDKIVQP